MRVEQLKDRLVANVRPILLMLFGAVIFVLLIACANVGGLTLARATSRSREFAIRAAVGASRFRMIRQLLIESLVLAIVGGVVGVLLAKYSFTMILPVYAFDNSSRVGAMFVPGSGALKIDSFVLGFTALLSITTGILFGLFPSLQTSRPAIIDALRDSGATAGRRSPGTQALLGLTLRSATVIGQVALSVILLIGSTLLLKSLVHLRDVDPGFSTSGLLTAKIPLPQKRYDTDQKKAAFVRELLNRVKRYPA